MNPSSVTRSFLGALATARWTDAAKLVHPESRRSTHSSAIAHFVAWAEFRALPKVAGQPSGYSHSGKVDPEALRALGHTVIPTYRGRPTINDLAALSPLAFVERLLDSANAPFGLLFRRFQDPYVLGHVMDGPKWAHVLIREGPPIPRNRRHDTDTISPAPAGSGGSGFRTPSRTSISRWVRTTRLRRWRRNFGSAQANFGR